MREERLSDAILYEKLDLMKNDFFGYIEHHSAKVDENLPVFYGHVLAALENSFPDLDDSAFDMFIDTITFKVLDCSVHGGEAEFISKVQTNAGRAKRKSRGTAGIDIMAGLNLLKKGDYLNAAPYLRKYATLDAMIGIAAAYCSYMLARQNQDPSLDGTFKPDDIRELEAREQMIELARLKVPIRGIYHPDTIDTTWMDRAFWTMIQISLDWFPDEQWFLKLGIMKAKADGNTAKRAMLLSISVERFYDSMFFLRELYYFRLEQRDAGGAAGVVKQMMQQRPPDDLEPVYYGLKLSLLTTRRITYYSFRRQARTHAMPNQVISMLDCVFELMSGKQYEALLNLKEIKKSFPELFFFTTAIEYIAHDFTDSDNTRVKRAKKALTDAVDQYCRSVLKIPL
ncbi:hypothetical protein [Methanosphaerula palustris]|uniref:Uncharacterized protein n=1 Tax=Methanosphaerula palustris (strain ATCC BAA-1556 / DSM 19958 / E1-9c) TaxID=521011 RepID=B8GIR9_METPE|nr:hypothetical protein [Methanosphaerula palustris]ACL16882.1 conserved hypothetical protein [Methanosphaerula palustris E1-9c]